MFNIPTLAQLVERARTSFAAEMPGGDAHLWPNNLNPTAKVIGQMTNEAMGYVDYAARQAFILTADWDHLLLHGREYGLAPNAASPAQGYVLITSTDQWSAPIGALLQRSDGVQYSLTAPVTVSVASTLSVAVQAVMPGANGNALAGTGLAIASAFSGPGASGLVAVVDPIGLTGGADPEALEPFRARVLFRKQYPPHGGAPSDYVAWAMSVPGVTRVFVERQYVGPGSVRVFILMDNAYPNGIPSPSDIAAVQAVFAANGPSGTLMTAAAPTPLPVPLVFAGLTPPGNAVQAAVLAEVQAAFLRLSRVAGGDVAVGGLPFLATPFTFSLGWLWQALTDATGVVRGQVLAPVADVVVPGGSIAIPGQVIFQ